MREILYRQWDGKKFHYWGIGLNENTFVGPISGGNPPINPSTTTHQQYTGLKDKNGKKIFESDVIKIYGYNAEVFFDEDYGGWAARTANDDGLYWHYGSWPKARNSYEVIGNAYEHPELLATQEETA